MGSKNPRYDRRKEMVRASGIGDCFSSVTVVRAVEKLPTTPALMMSVPSVSILPLVRSVLSGECGLTRLFLLELGVLKLKENVSVGKSVCTINTLVNAN